MIREIKRRLGFGPDEYVIIREKPDREIVDRSDQPMSPVAVDSRVSSDEWKDGRYRCQAVENGRYGSVLWSETFGDPEIEADRDEEIEELRELIEKQDRAIRGLVSEVQDGNVDRSDLDGDLGSPELGFKIETPTDYAMFKAMEDDEWLENRIGLIEDRVSSALDPMTVETDESSAEAADQEQQESGGFEPREIEGGPADIDDLIDDLSEPESDPDPSPDLDLDADAESDQQAVADGGGELSDEEIADRLPDNDDGQKLMTDGGFDDNGVIYTDDSLQVLRNWMDRRFSDAELRKIASHSNRSLLSDEMKRAARFVQQESDIRAPSGPTQRRNFLENVAEDVLDQRKTRRAEMRAVADGGLEQLSPLQKVGILVLVGLLFIGGGSSGGEEGGD